MQFPYEKLTSSAAETEELGYSLGKYLCENGRVNTFIAMYGDLGAGKTAFVRGLALYVAPSAHACSPT